MSAHFADRALAQAGTSLPPATLPKGSRSLQMHSSKCAPAPFTSEVPEADKTGLKFSAVSP